MHSFNINKEYAKIMNVLEDIVANGVRKETNINIRNKMNWTPLHYAVKQNNLEAVCKLLYYNADVNVVGDNVGTPFTLALSLRYSNIAKILVDYYDKFYYPDLSNSLESSETLWEDVYRSYQCSTTKEYTNVLLLSLEFKSAELFKLIWPKFDTGDMLEFSKPFFIVFIDYAIFSNLEWIEGMYLMLQSPFAFDMIEICLNYHFMCGRSLFSILLDKFNVRQIQLEDRLSIIYILLGLGCEVTAYDIRHASLYNFNKELEIFLYTANYQRLSFDWLLFTGSLFLHPSLMFLVPSLNANMIVELFKTQVVYLGMRPLKKDVQKYIIKSLGYFALSLTQKEDLAYSKCVLKEHHLVDERIEELPNFPSLVELCRTKICKTICVDNYMKFPYEFFDNVRKLNLSKHLEDIITFRKIIY